MSADPDSQISEPVPETPSPGPPAPDLAASLLPSPVNPLQAQTHREQLEVMAQIHRERLEIWINFTANGLAFSIVIGFFCIVAIALLGFADIRDATVAAFVGTTLGYVVGSIAPISQFYYKAIPMKIEGWIGERERDADKVAAATDQGRRTESK